MMDPSHIGGGGGGEAHCTGGTLTSGFGWFIQMILATGAFGCLIIKRFLEPRNNRRSWLVWVFDTSKQGVGAIVIHLINIFLAELVADKSDPCTIYIISFLLDSTIGLLIIYWLIQLICFYAIKHNHELFIFGEYGKPKPQTKYWLAQTTLYVMIVLVEKLFVTILLTGQYWHTVSKWLLAPIPSPELEVVLVVLIIPFFVNVLMFWVTDNFLIMHRGYQRLKAHSANSCSSGGSNYSNYSAGGGVGVQYGPSGPSSSSVVTSAISVLDAHRQAVRWLGISNGGSGGGGQSRSDYKYHNDRSVLVDSADDTDLVDVHLDRTTTTLHNSSSSPYGAATVSPSPIYTGGGGVGGNSARPIIATSGGNQKNNNSNNVIT